ncbi:MAG: T9SS type A sorting domain-containing protein [Flavobacteriaceae bacterium]|nr:T9SS type A sorting domain-containing protein [Flavobacteriaceae bacterium]
MKKNYLFILVMYAAIFSVNAQIIDEDFELYTLGDMSDQNPTVWSSSSGNPLMDNALQVIEDGNGEQIGYMGFSTGQDVLLLLGNFTTGHAILQLQVFIPAGGTGYFNIQGQTETNVTTGYEGAGDSGNGIFNSGGLYFNPDGVNPGIFVDETTGETGTYPEDEWFTVEIIFDLFNFKYEIKVDDNLVNLSPVPFQADNVLGAIHFFAIDGNHNLFLDNVFFGFPIASIDDASNANIQMYPNPVKDLLNIRSTIPIDNIQIYDMLGTLVSEITPNPIEATIDMSSLPSGIYLVKVSIKNTTRTIKVVK